MNAITLTNGSLPAEIVNEYIALEQRMKEDKAKMDELKSSLLQAMEEGNVIKIDTDAIRITYVAPVDRETFDSKQFRADMPDLYDAYVKLSKTAPSLRITVK